MQEDNKSKVVVILSDAEHKILKGIVAETRRTLGQELAFRAFQAISTTKPARRAASTKPGCKCKGGSKKKEVA